MPQGVLPAEWDARRVGEAAGWDAPRVGEAAARRCDESVRFSRPGAWGSRMGPALGRA
ncbi:Uncharacterised protein [Mycobacteroides abscessus subsp. abscessus]|nr:Uncharacterised protein [Mycobacteroides abscessus subsp. abscessus]